MCSEAGLHDGASEQALLQLMAVGVHQPSLETEQLLFC